MPQDAVQGVFRAGVDLPEIQAGRDMGVPTEERVGDIFGSRVHLVERDSIGHGFERREIRRDGKAVEHRRGRRIELVHRGKTEDLFDRPQEAYRVVLRADDSATLRVRADTVGGRAVAAHMIESVLRVVLDPENNRIFPKAASAERFDDAAEGQVVVGHTGRRCWGTRAGPARVIVGQADQDELRHLP